jgi:membrane associated rhomboid family serine protease
MNSELVTIFTSANERNIETLAGILQTYKIAAEIKELNGSWSLQVPSEIKEGASAIIKKHIRTPGKKNNLVSGGTSFVLEYKMTAAIIILCTAVFCLSSFGQNLNLVRGLFYSDLIYQRTIENNQITQTPEFQKGITQLKNGQIWRILTPSLLHNNLIHLLINLALIFQLARMIEKISSSTYLLILCLTSTILSNITEYHFTGTPHFGGMSPLSLALFGFIWMRSIYDTCYASKVNPGLITFSAIWLAASFLNLFQINNKYGTIAGLIFGLTWGFLSSRLLPKERLIPRQEKLY